MLQDTQTTPNLEDIDVKALANKIEAEMIVASAAHPNKPSITSVDTDELVNTLQSVREMAYEKKVAMDRKIEKIRQRFEPFIDSLNDDIAQMEQELANRIKAVGGRGAHTDAWTVEIKQDTGKLVKNVPLLKGLEKLLTPAEYDAVFKVTPKTSTVEDFDARKLNDLRDFYGAETPVGKLISSGLYHAPTAAEIVITPRQDLPRAA
jgi:hypothetical protein